MSLRELCLVDTTDVARRSLNALIFWEPNEAISDFPDVYGCMLWTCATATLLHVRDSVLAAVLAFVHVFAVIGLCSFLAKLSILDSFGGATAASQLGKVQIAHAIGYANLATVGVLLMHMVVPAGVFSGFLHLLLALSSSAQLAITLFKLGGASVASGVVAV